MVGEDVGVASIIEGALLPPSLETQIQDEDGEREEEEGSGDVEDSDDKMTDCEVEAIKDHWIKGGVGRGRDVDGHVDCM